MFTPQNHLHAVIVPNDPEVVNSRLRLNFECSLSLEVFKPAVTLTLIVCLLHRPTKSVWLVLRYILPT